MTIKEEIIRNVLAAREPDPAPVAPAPVAAAPAPVAAPIASDQKPPVDYSAMWRRAIEKEAAAVLAHRRALGLD